MFFWFLLDRLVQKFLPMWIDVCTYALV